MECILCCRPLQLTKLQTSKKCLVTSFLHLVRKILRPDVKTDII